MAEIIELFAVVHGGVTIGEHKWARSGYDGFR